MPKPAHKNKSEFPFIKQLRAGAAMRDSICSLMVFLPLRGTGSAKSCFQVPVNLGPSNYGLAEPAIASCISLQQAAGALLMTKPDRQRIASLLALQNMIRETSEAFRDAEQRIIKEDSELQAAHFESPLGRKKG
jgi:uracil phosphoribosyltransferase